MTLLSDYTSSIALWLDEGRPLTPKWVAIELGISAAAAAKLLYSYKQRHPSSSASYLVSGVDEEGRLVVAVVPEAKLDEAKAGLKKIRSVQVYSLQSAWTDELPGQIYSINMHHSTAIVASAETAEKYLKNDFGQIRCPGLRVASPGTRHESLVRAASLTRDPSASSADASLVSKKQPASVAMSAGLVSGPSKAPSAAASLTAPKVSAVAQNFFNNPSAAKSKSAAKLDSSSVFKAAPSKAEPTSSGLAQAVTLSNESSSVKGSATEEVDEDGEWNDGDAYTTDKKNLKRRRNPVIRDEDDEPNSAPGAPSSEAPSPAEDDLAFLNDDDVDQDQKKKIVPKGKYKVHGAMDDFIEDAAIASYKKSVAEGVTPAESESSTHTTKRRKLVPKVFTDDKGYLITEMVWEECSDTEAESVPPKTVETAPKPTISNTNSTKPVKAASKSTKEAPQGAQKSMMAFFGKK